MTVEETATTDTEPKQEPVGSLDGPGVGGLGQWTDGRI